MNGGLDVSEGSTTFGFQLDAGDADSFTDIKQGPWSQSDTQNHLRRDFEYEIEYLDTLSKRSQR